MAAGSTQLQLDGSVEGMHLRGNRSHSRFYSGLTNGLFEPKHEKAMGKAVWLFGWLVGRQTAQSGSVGLVLGEKVLTWRWVSTESGWPERTLQRWGQILRREGYVEILSGQHGFVIRILNAKKFRLRQPGLSPATPKVARLATNGTDKSGDPGDKSGGPADKSGDPGSFRPYMKSKGKARGKANRTTAEPSLFQAARDYAFQEFQNHFSQPPTWDESDYSSLANLVKRRPDLGLEEFRRRWDAFLTSTEPFIAKQGFRLRYFCSNFDTFLHGPVRERRDYGGSRTHTEGNLAAARNFLREAR